MTTPRFYCPEILTPSGMAELPEQAAHHAARVLRLQAGDSVSVFNGRGGEGEARIADIGKRNVTVKIAGTKKQDHLSLKSTIMDALGVTAFSKDLFTSGVCTYTFEWAGSMDQIKQALLDTQKVFFVEMDNDSITFKRVV